MQVTELTDRARRPSVRQHVPWWCHVLFHEDLGQVAQKGEGDSEAARSLLVPRCEHDSSPGDVRRQEV